MKSRRAGPDTLDCRIDRRTWLVGMAAGWWGLSARAEEPEGARPDLPGEPEAVADLAAKLGLGPFRVSRTAHYLGIGDAPDAFRAQALVLCEAVARDYLEYFPARGFAVTRPEHRLTVVILADADAFAAFLGTEPGAAVGGLYDLETNRLVVYDYRSQGRAAAPRAGRANTIALAHEATHQLTFNTGLLDRQGDVPLCISEGLAMYVEVRPPSGKSPPGQPNPGRLQGLTLGLRRGLSWIPVDRLIADDAPLGGDAGELTQQLAYAQSWLLVYHRMKDPERLPRFRDYLAVICPRRAADRRVEDARQALGDLDRLDRDLKARARKLIG
jgi:Protein of unknown function (DUF1570)